MEELRVVALDGRPLAATLFAPASPRAALVVNSALGVKRSYYARFAAALAERGVAVLTYDYRGVGGSVIGRLRDEHATLLDWAQLDVGGALDAARARFPGVPVWGLGHSFGGQAFGLTARALELDGLVIVAAGSGDLRLYPQALAWKYRLLLTAVPAIGAAWGYIPRQFGLGEDLPAGVVGQWGRFCRTPGYVRGAVAEDGLHYRNIRRPMAFVEVPDDDYAPAAAAAELRSWYTGATSVRHRIYTPAELGMPKIGHFGMFRRGPTERIWADIADWVA